MNSKVLVTGGGGFVGLALVRELCRQGRVVRVLGRHRYPDAEAAGAISLQGDIRDLESVRDIGNLLLLLDLLRTHVGGLLVQSNLAQDIFRSHRKVSRPSSLFLRMYLLFLVRPYTRSLPRSIQKPPKVYFLIIRM